jgi:hypothetical protein
MYNLLALEVIDSEDQIVPEQKEGQLLHTGAI